MLCRECRKVEATQDYDLCKSCYYTPAIHKKYRQAASLRGTSDPKVLAKSLGVSPKQIKRWLTPPDVGAKEGADLKADSLYTNDAVAACLRKEDCEAVSRDFTRRPPQNKDDMDAGIDPAAPGKDWTIYMPAHLPGSQHPLAIVDGIDVFIDQRDYTIALAAAFIHNGCRYQVRPQLLTATQIVDLVKVHKQRLAVYQCMLTLDTNFKPCYEVHYAIVPDIDVSPWDEAPVAPVAAPFLFCVRFNGSLRLTKGRRTMCISEDAIRDLRPVNGINPLTEIVALVCREFGAHGLVLTIRECAELWAFIDQVRKSGNVILAGPSRG